MTREQIKQHWADVVSAVFKAEDAVKPTLKERLAALGDNPTQEQKDALARQYCLDIAEEMLKGWSDKVMKNLKSSDL